MKKRHSTGFTLIETMVAITILTMAVVAPMSLASQSLSSAYYARDQVTAFHLAQEGIEAVRAARDSKILNNAQSATPLDLLAGIPTGVPFAVDTRDNRMTQCTTGTCPYMRTDGTFYAYGPVGTTNIYQTTLWNPTRFRRTITAEYIAHTIPSATPRDEIKITVKVEWRTGRFGNRSVTITENLYRWVQDGSAI